jgi:hypothetical protein
MAHSLQPGWTELSWRKEGGAVAGVTTRRFDSPDETRTPEKTKIDLVRLGDSMAARTTFQPGWKWSECLKPLTGTDSCQARHVGTAISGRLHVVHEDGTEAEIGPGDAYLVEPGHDGWVVGDEPYVAIEFDSKTVETYTKI